MSVNSVESAFILAAGKGERLRPHTYTRPKPLLKINNEPILHHILRNLIPMGLKRVVVNAWHLAEQIVEYCDSIRGEFPFEIRVSREDRLLGTGGGLKKAWPLIERTPFLMMNGDCLWKADLNAFVQQALGSTETMASWWLTDEKKDQTPIGVQNSEIIQIGDLWKKAGTHPDPKRGCFSGVQIFRELDSEALPDEGCIIRNYWIPKLTRGERLAAYQGRFDYWHDIGTPERYESLLKSFRSS